ncbi:MAG: energy transducer TonB [Verrucomicrobiales bacterium]
MVRSILALLLTAALLVFLAAMRLEFASDAPVLSMRSIDRIDPVSLPAPPPPTAAETPPPPPPPTDLPKLDLELDSVAPPIKASIDREVDLDLSLSDFAPRNEGPREEMTFSSAELDAQPQLVNKPSATFPASQKRQGVTEGRVTLEVHINSAGRVTVRRVLSSSHEDFVAMARSFATRARFTPPKKDGRPVNAVFKWPLILRP